MGEVMRCAYAMIVKRTRNNNLIIAKGSRSQYNDDIHSVSIGQIVLVVGIQCTFYLVVLRGHTDCGGVAAILHTKTQLVYRSSMP